jgi:hypothetical protein
VVCSCSSSGNCGIACYSGAIWVSSTAAERSGAPTASALYFCSSSASGTARGWWIQLSKFFKVALCSVCLTQVALGPSSPWTVSFLSEPGALYSAHPLPLIWYAKHGTMVTSNACRQYGPFTRVWYRMGACRTRGIGRPESLGPWYSSWTDALSRRILYC